MSMLIINIQLMIFLLRLNNDFLWHNILITFTSCWFGS